MSNKDIFFLAFRNILSNKMKFFLTSISICIGICSVMIITTVGDIGSALINEKLNAMGIDGLYVSTRYNDVFLDQELIKTIENMFEIEEIMPIISNFSTITTNRYNGKAMTFGVDHTLYDTLQITSLEGRCFTESEVKLAEKVSIIDENLANDLYGRTNVIGKNISLTFNGVSQEFEIIGVISNQKELVDSFLGDDFMSFVYIPYTVSQNSNQNDEISQIAIRASSNLDTLKNDLEFYFSKQQELDGMLKVQNISSYIEIISDITRYLTIILSFVAGIGVIVAGIGVLNSMLSSTIERKKEIGVYMALGAENSQVGKIFLVECVIICLFSGVIGAIIGISIVFIGVKLVDLPFFINYKFILIIEGISFLCGILAGIIPAVKASRLNPIDILRE